MDRSGPGVRAAVAFLIAVLLLAGVAAGGPQSDAAAAPDAAVDHAQTGDAAASPADPTLGAAETGATAADAADTIRVRNELFATDEAGTVGVTTRVQTVPDRITALRVTILTMTDASVDPDGFERVDDAERDGVVWAWDGETDEPSITYAMAANDTVAESGPLAGDGTYRFVDTGEWALVRTPRVGVSARYTGSGQLRVARENRVSGEGAASETMAFLGAHETHVRETDGRRVRLIVPEAADLAASPAAVFGAFEGARAALPVGGDDAEVFAVAAPTEDVSWAVRGLQTGDADLWVRDREPAGTAADVWTHEYVHTRQAYRAEPSARWFTEASATYYAALFALDRGAIGFDRFEQTVSRGEREPDASAVLTDPGTWRPETPYTKGSLVAGEIDRRIRLAADGRASLATVFRDLNDASEPITNRAVLDAIEAAAAEGGDDEAAAAVRDAAERLTTTSDVPETWDRDAHAAAFERMPARVGYGLAPDGVYATGEYRNRSVARDPVRLAAGETLELTVEASNTGSVSGSYAITMSVDGEPVETRSETLAAGSETAERFAHTFTDPGEYEVRVGSETLTVVVSDPAPVLVRGVSTDTDRVTAGEPVTVTATLANDAAIPAGSDVEFRVDGESLATVPVRLDAGGETTATRALTLDASGEVAVTVAGPAGEATATVRVEPPGGGEESDGDTTDETPGFGPLVAVVALLCAAGACVGRSRDDR
ncbi:MAG: PGF-CTERM archaeal protein-sorting signal [uncultured archaeon A07HR67]|nr:MAG: PGF-CTERM archaeal protein-sorting signal [uncultured archaeon A07HR67]